MQDTLTVGVGGVVGFLLGLLGGGGSIIAVPLLIYGVGLTNVHLAIGTSATAVSFSALANLISHARQGAVKWPCATVFSASGIIGTFGGSTLAQKIPGQQLLSLFGALMLMVSATMLLRKNAEGDPDVRLTLKTAKRMLPWLISTGLAVGALSGFFGIGGGFLIVPALIFATGMPIRNAIATSLAAITVFGASSAATYAYHGQVDWRLAADFITGGIAGGIAGTVLGRMIGSSKSILNHIFAGLLAIIGLFLVSKDWVLAS
jgi:uncharacterized protein